MSKSTQAASQPKDFGFDADAVALKDVAERFFLDNLPTHKLHGLVANDSDLQNGSVSRWDEDLWQQIVSLGWLMVAVPERVGGMGMSAVAVTALVEQAGRAALPGPLVPTLSACYILDACGTDNADAALNLLCEGKSFSYATCNENGSWEHDASELVLENNRLNGALYFVQDAQKVDYFLINTRHEDEPTLVIVPATADGLTIEPNTIIDLTRDQACLRFDQVSITDNQVVSAPGRTLAALETATPALLTLVCAKNNGCVLEQIFSPLVVRGGEFPDELREIAARCVTRHHYHHYRGFYGTQRRLLEKQSAKTAHPQAVLLAGEKNPTQSLCRARRMDATVTLRTARRKRRT